MVPRVDWALSMGRTVAANIKDRELVRDGRLPPVHRRLAANIVTFLPTMLALRRWDLRRRMSREAMLDGVTAFLLRGLGASDRIAVPARRRRPNGSGRI